MGCFMKKILCFSLSILILTISILVYCPLGVFASYPDDYYSLPKPYTDGMSLSSSDAQAAVNSHKDIADSRGILCFQYTPTNTYNWTVNTKKQAVHLSDSQLKNLLMSKHSLSSGFLEFIYGTSNSDAFRGFMSFLGVATKTGSSAYLDISDKITGNYNFLDSIDYNEDTQTIVMSNDNSSVDKLREEIKKYYYNSIGIVEYQCRGTVLNLLNSSNFTGLFEYEEDKISSYNAYSEYKYALIDFSSSNSYSQSNHNIFWNDTDYVYLGSDLGYAGGSLGNKVYKLYSFSNDTAVNFIENKKIVNRYDVSDEQKNITALFTNPNGSYCSQIYTAHTNTTSSFGGYPYESYYAIPVSQYDYTYFYSYNNEPFRYFKSYSAMYNYLHGDQNAYLSSTIEKTGEDITFSIKDMNENLGSKMDTLIDSINSNKSNMSADDLQNAIDKGLEDLNKNTEDIKDNTAEMNNKLDSIIVALNTQNATLLEILGITKKISDTVDNIDETASFNSVVSLCGTVFLAIQTAILYGQNTLKDDNAEPAELTYSTALTESTNSGGTSFDYRGGIFGHFPFSVIYHLYDWLKVLQTQPKCPVFAYNYGFLIGKKDDEECVITFDLSQYEDWRNTISSFMKLSFTLAVAVGTYKKFKGGDLT